MQGSIEGKSTSFTHAFATSKEKIYRDYTETWQWDLK